MSAEAALYSPREELANTATHALGVVLSAGGLAWIVTHASEHGDGWQVVSAAIFGVSLVMLYTASTLYHALRGERVKRLLRTLDHAAIFVLIAGTYTPFLLVNLRGPWGWTLFGIVWALAATGIALKFRFTGRFNLLSTLVYLGMGWLCLVAARPLLLHVEPGGLWLLLAGGLCYTGGTVFYLWEKLRYHHAVWHLFVLAGSGCHFFAILGYVLSGEA